MTNDMLASVLEYWVAVFVLGLSRVAAFMMTFPFFRFARIPNSVKISMSVFLTFIWIVNRHADVNLSMTQFENSSWLYLGINIAREVVVGGTLGFAFGLVFLPARIAGTAIGQEMGLSLASLTDPNTGQTTSVISELLFAVFVLVFLGMDGHLLTLGAVFASFDRFPIATADLAIPPHWFANGIDVSTHMGLQLVGPVLGSLFVVTVLLSVIMKISPQLNLFTFGTGVRLLVGMASFCLFFPEIVISMHRVVTNLFTMAGKFGL